MVMKSRDTEKKKIRELRRHKVKPSNPFFRLNE